MARLPKPGGDAGNWGEILNEFLQQEHNDDGSLKQDGSLATKYTKPANGILGSDLHDDVQASLQKADVSLDQAEVEAEIDQRVPIDQEGDLLVGGPGGTSTALSIGPIGGRIRRKQGENRPSWAASDALMVADFVLATDGTDWLPASNRALAALPAAGGTLTYPSGRLDFSARLVVTKTLVLQGTGSGLDAGLRPTELRFPAGSDGVVLTGSAKKSVVRQIAVTSLSNGTGLGVGVRCRATRALISDVYVEKFGEHGVFFDTAVRSATAGTEIGGVATLTAAGHGYVVGESIFVAGFTPGAYNGSKTITAVTANTVSFAITAGTGNATVLGTFYAGNANLSRAEGIRSLFNGGDGIRVEGADCNAITLINVDGSGNGGYGIANLSAKTGVYSPHASGNEATVSDGVTTMDVDYYDRGSSAVWINPYSEGSQAFFIDTDNSDNGYLLSVGTYAAPTVWSGSGSGVPLPTARNACNVGWVVVDGNVHQLSLRFRDPAGAVEWRLASGQSATDQVQLRDQTNNRALLTFITGAAGAARMGLFDGMDLDPGTSTGTKVGINSSRKLAFWGKTPIVQPSSAAQAALTNSTGGATDGTLSAVSGSGADATINDNFAELYVLLNAIRQALVDEGLIKGSA